MADKKLYRSNTVRVLGGVCGGLADYFKIDVTLLRLLWAAAVFMAGTGLLFYILCWLIIPEETSYRVE